MKVNGIIAEYNPFHNGHLYQLAESRRLTGADYTIVVMSGDFVQRGAPAMLDKHVRARMALLGGADLVLELPVLHAVSSAEQFAAGAVALLDRLGVVTHLCFGSECGDPDVLGRIAGYLLEEPDSYRSHLQSLLRQGHSYPAARARALSLHAVRTGDDAGSSEDWARILSSPNNILGIDYIKALKKRHSPITPVTVRRIGAGYHDCELQDGRDIPILQPNGAQQIPPTFATQQHGTQQISGISTMQLHSPQQTSAITAMQPHGTQQISNASDSQQPRPWKTSDISAVQPHGTQHHNPQHAQDSLAASSVKPSSARAIRQALRNGVFPEQLRPYLPESSAQLLEDCLSAKKWVRPDDFSSILYYKLLTQKEQGYENYLDVSAALSDRIRNRLGEFTGWESFCDILKTKDVTYTRISRCLLHILLGIEKAHLNLALSLDHAPYARMLGFRRSAAPLLGAIKAHSSIPLLAKLAHAQSILSTDADRMLRQDIYASDIYQGILSCNTGLPPRNEFAAPLVIL